MIGFLPLLAEIAGNQEIEIPVRQAGVIFFKNGIQRGWVVDEEEEKDATPVSEQDKSVIRAKIVSQIVYAPPPIRLALFTDLYNLPLPKNIFTVYIYVLHYKIFCDVIILKNGQIFHILLQHCYMLKMQIVGWQHLMLHIVLQKYMNIVDNKKSNQCMILWLPYFH